MTSDGGRTSVAGRFAGAVDSLAFIVVTWMLVPVERVITADTEFGNLRPVYICMLAVIARGLLAMRHGVPRSGVLRGLAGAQLVAALAAVGLYVVGVWPHAKVGWVGWLVFDVVFMVCALVALATVRGLAWRWCRGLQIAAVVWSVVAIVQWLASFIDSDVAYDVQSHVPRVHGLSYEPSYLAIFLLPAAFLLLTDRRGLELGLVLTGLAVTTSRTGIVGLAVGLVAVLLVRSTEARRRAVAAMKWMALALVILLPLALLVPAGRSFLRFMRTSIDFGSGGTTADRWESWRMGWQLFKDRPFLGWGPGGTGESLHEVGLRLAIPADELKLTNLVAEVGAELGAIGLLALAVWTVVPIAALRKYTSGSQTAGIFLGAIALSMSTYPFFQTWWRPTMWFTFLLVQAAWVLHAARGRDADPAELETLPVPDI